MTTMALSLVSLSSCFKDEAPNAECDITKAWIHVDNPEDMFFQTTDTAINVRYDMNEILFRVRRKTDVSCLAPWFEITPGAKISPANGSVQDFSNGPVTYTVTSEDGNWSRRYAVTVSPTTMIVPDTISFAFENAKVYTDSKTKATYYKWYETDENGNDIEYWANANAGFAMSKSSAAPEEYPSVAVDGYEGKSVKLTTSSTGALGELVNRPLAAGNFYIGEFDVSLALINTLHCSRMGLPFTKKPVKVTGMYKYKAGDVYWDYVNYKKVERPDVKDEAVIYASFYRNHDDGGNPVMLYGDDSKTNPNIVAFASVEKVAETDVWTPFEMTFTYFTDIDLDELERRGYSLTVVFSSSAAGDYYKGAPGSTLMIDNVRIICESEE